MTTPTKNLCAALWTHLSNQSAYTALALHHFKFYDGAVIPYDVKTGRINADILPAHSSRITDGGRESLEGDRRHPGVSRRWFVTMENTLIYRASEGDSTLGLDLVDTAMSVVADALDVRTKRDALIALMGGGEFAWSPTGGPQVGRSGPESGLPRLWAWPWTITLSGVFTHI